MSGARFKIRPAALVLLVLSALPAAAQDAARPVPVFRAGLEMVNLTVSVRDNKGRFVGNLAAGDFTILEDGRKQQIRLFAPALQPGQDQALALDLGLLLDTSESMAREIRLSQEAAVRFLEAVPRARDLLTIFFDQDIRISRFQSEQQQGLFERLAEMKGRNTTALYDAITVYLSRAEDLPGRKVLVVFTDGEDSTSAMSASELFQVVRSSNVTIYPIAFTGSLPVGSHRALAARSFLHTLAELTGGEVFLPRGSRQLGEIYQMLLDELQTQYVLGFSSDNARQDGRYRRLKITVSRPGLKLRYRAGYLVPAE
jgi:Ca-activated chloride channel family protein